MQSLQLVKSERFGEIQADIYSDSREMFMTINQLSECLGYASTAGLGNVISRNEYLNSPEFSTTHKLCAVEGGREVNRDIKVFTEDGIYEITMLSSQPRAKEFRAWVRGVLKSLRKGGATLIGTDKLDAIKIHAQQDRARAMLLNAQNRALKTLMLTIVDKKLSPIAIEVFGLKSIEQVTGVDMGQHLPHCERTYSATQIGKMFGVSANKVGVIANANGLKTDENGVFVMDKSRYSSKEIPVFRYNANGLGKLRGILECSM